MTADELGAVLKGIAPVVREYVSEALRGLTGRVEELETRPAVTGPAGKDGRDGIDGKDGAAGAPGAAGKDGADGLHGKDGRDGIDGKDGAVGLNGKDGRDGLNGKDGAAGLNGKDGRDGIDGKDGANGLNGKDADPTVIAELQQQIKALRDELLLVKAQPDLVAIKALVSEAVAALPVPKDGRDGRDIDPSVVDAMVAGAVSVAMKAIPTPQDGRSVTIADVQPLIVAEVEKAVKAVPVPKDGLGVQHATIDGNGHFVLTFTDGKEKDLGRVVGEPGRDGLPGVPGWKGEKGDAGRDGIDGKHGINGKDGANGLNGKDGLGFDDLAFVFEDTKGWIARFRRGDLVKDYPLGVPFDAGVWKAGKYPKGASVTRRGSLFIAQRDTAAIPDENTPESRDWRLAVKSGRDGKPGRDGRDAI